MVAVPLSPGLRPEGSNEAYVQPASASVPLVTWNGPSTVAPQTGAPVVALVIGIAEAGHEAALSHSPQPGSAAPASKAHKLHASRGTGRVNGQRNGADRSFMQVRAAQQETCRTAKTRR